MLKAMVSVPGDRLAAAIASLKERVPSGPAGLPRVPPSRSSAVVVTVKVEGTLRSSKGSRRSRQGGFWEWNCLKDFRARRFEQYRRAKNMKILLMEHRKDSLMKHECPAGSQVASRCGQNGAPLERKCQE